MTGSIHIGMEHADGGDEGGTDAFTETSVPNSELVVFVARSVGVLVAVVAVILAILIMMVFRAAIAVMLHKMGISGVTAVVALLVYCVLKWGHITTKLIWTVLTRSCC